MEKLISISKIPIEAAIEASKAIMKIYQGEFERVEKEDGSPVTIADLTSSKILREYLKQTDLPITGEEQEKAPYESRKTWDKSWCIDPLDGTKEFIKRNGEFVINIALLKEQKSIFGIIASPVQERIILGGPELGAYEFSFDDANNPEKWKNLQGLKPITDPITVISSRSHYTGDILSLIHSIEENYNKFESIKMGSALKFFHLVNGEADVYPRFAPTMEWDIAAGQAIFEALGGEIINIKTGQPLIYNKENLLNPYFIAYNKHVPKNIVFSEDK
jgi:3'(2'), 5'-bisphosphate nucleotidase